MNLRNLILALSIAALQILTACAATSNPSQSIRVTMTDFTFTPNSFTVPAGAQISFEATNTGAVAHSFVVLKLGHILRAHFTPDDQAYVYWEQTEIPPGGTVQATFAAPPEPGEYQVVCAVGGHFEAGMVAKLVAVAQP